MVLHRLARAIALIALSVSFTACNSVSTPTGSTSAEDDYLAVDVSSSEQSRVMTLLDDGETMKSREVTLPDDLLDGAAGKVSLELRASDLYVALFNPTTSAKVAGAVSEKHAAVTFRLSGADSDACSSSVRVGPFGVILGDSGVTLSNSSWPLTGEARDLIYSGRFAICPQTLADFSGSIVARRLTIKFSKENDDGKGDDDKVELCHIPPGNPDNAHTITVGEAAVEAHLAHGDYVGPCLEPLLDLVVTAACSEDPDAQRRWRVTNPNDDMVAITWLLDDSDQAGAHEAEPGDTFFTTATVPGDNIMTITWLDDDEVQHSDASASTEEVCEDEDADDGGDGGMPVDYADTDGDGIDDPFDQCPATPAGENVDTRGCTCAQLDTDQDGVVNCEDACPGTPSGETVNEQGCGLDSLDDDGDGVPNGDDVCPMTPANQAADLDGCSCSQRDMDADGVSDCDDLCPGTPRDATVDVAGCPVMTADAGPNVTVFDIGCVTLEATATGGTPPYTYTWSAPGWEGSTEQYAVVVPTETTTYTLTVTDWSSPPQTATDTVTVALNPRADLQYTIVDLGAMGGQSSYAAGLNNHGEVVGYLYTASWERRAFLYSGGTMNDLGSLGGNEAYARAINDAGVVVGESKDAGGVLRPFIWDAENGMRDLGTLGGPSGSAHAINNLGQIVGFADSDTGSHAFRYSNGNMRDVGTLGFDQSGAFGINDHGDVVGTYLANGTDQRAFVFEDNSLFTLEETLFNASRAVDINNEGLLAGYSWALGEFRSYLDACGTAVDLGTAPGFSKTFAWGMNNHGQIVGNVSGEIGSPNHAFIFTGGYLRDLNDLLEPGHGWDFVAVAFDINDYGQIVGYGQINSVYHAFLMTPVP